MRDLAAAGDLLPAGFDPDDPAVRQAKLFEPGDPLPPGALALDLADLGRGPFPVEGAAPRAPAGALILTDVSACAEVWRRLTGE